MPPSSPAATTHLEVAVFSVDPPALDLIHGLDPETFIIASALADPLVCVDENGAVQPALAVSWEQTSLVTWRLVLREGVRFADGSPMDADDVVATFAQHLDPTNRTVAGRGSFAMLEACRRISSHEVEIETAAPDNMFLRRLAFSMIYPKARLEQGREAVRTDPSACGAYTLERWTKGVEIVLRKNPLHWAGRDGVDTVRIPILRQKNWVEALRKGELDVALGLDANDKARIEGEPGIRAVTSDAAISHFFLLKHEGPLANLRVRKALNHAVHRQLLVDIAEHGHGRPQRSIATSHTFGYAPDIDPYVYNPDLARRILAEEGYERGFTLRGAVSETSTAVFHAVKEFLSRIDVNLEADVMPRADWVATVRGPKLRNEGVYQGDFAFFSTGHPMLHASFHQFIFLFSRGDWSLLNDAEYDKRFLRALAVTGRDSEEALRDLERYIVDNAMILFTAQAAVHAAMREGVVFPLPRGGHFNTSFWWNLRSSITHQQVPVEPGHASNPPIPDLGSLIQATSHLGTLYLAPGTTFERSAPERIWANLDATQQRWETQLTPMLRELVSQVETKTHLANVLDSTERVAICGIADDGRQLFVNEGYRRMLGADTAPLSAVAALWTEIRRCVDESGVWAGPVRVTRAGDEQRKELYLTVTRARDPQHVATGYTLVFSDFSGEEERIRNSAIRAILDNVPYGLFRCARDGKVLPGYSAACHGLLPGAQSHAIEGTHFVQLLGAEPRMADHLSLLYEQLCDDLLPEEVSIQQFPKRIAIRGKTLGLAPAALRGDDGNIVAVLFSVFDETERAAAERSQEYLRGVMNVLEHRDAFSMFVREVVSTSEELLASVVASDPTWQAIARRFVHTCKAVFAQFGLVSLARRLHELEDADAMGTDTLHEMRSALRELLAENDSLWRLSFDDCAPEYALRASDFDSLEAALAAAATVEEARAVARRWSDGHQRRTVGDLLGAMGTSCQQHAERRGKQARFVLVGGELMLPARQWAIVTSLTHVVRNAVDHGIEPPEARGEKEPCGEIRVAFSEQNAHVVCRVSDDGRGIDVERLIARAQREGVLTDEEAETMGTEAALALVFRDGLSSADEVTDTAGRGVGMGAVKSAVEGLGGVVTIETELGRGTTIELRWPRSRAA